MKMATKINSSQVGVLLDLSDAMKRGLNLKTDFQKVVRAMYFMSKLLNAESEDNTNLKVFAAAFGACNKDNETIDLLAALNEETGGRGESSRQPFANKQSIITTRSIAEVSGILQPSDILETCHRIVKANLVEKIKSHLISVDD